MKYIGSNMLWGYGLKKGTRILNFSMLLLASDEEITKSKSSMTMLVRQYLMSKALNT
jgi:hypothetical protein